MPPKRQPGRRPNDRPPDLCYYKPKRLACVYVNGKRKYLGPWGSEKATAAYRDLVSAWEEKRRAKPAVRAIGTPRTVAALVLAFLDHAEVYYRGTDGKRTHEATSFRISLRPLLEQHGARDQNDLRFEHVRAIRDSWVAEGKERGYVNQMLGRIKTFLRWGLEQRYISREVVADVCDVKPLKKGRSAARERVPIGSADLRDVWDAMERLPAWLHPAVLFVLRVGARPGEVCAAHASQFHGPGSVIGGSVVVPPGVIAFAPPHKTRWRGKTVIYALGPKVQWWLAPLIARGGYLFPAPRRASHIREDWLATTIAEACEAAGCGKWTPNMLRHAYLSRRQRNAGWERARQSVMHSSISTTEIYVQRDLSASAEDAAKWD